MTDAKNNGANPSETKRDPSRNARKHGLYTLKRAVKELGNRAIDRRTKSGKALYTLREQLIADLGGDSKVTTAKLLMVDTAIKTTLILNSVDAYILELGDKIINKRNRCVYPIVPQRNALADSQAKQLKTLGLERISADVPTLAAYIEGKAT